MSLKVTIGVVKRAVKELDMYRKEVADGEAKIISMTKDEMCFGQTRDVLQESRTMVDHTLANLTKALQDLESKLDASSPLNDEAKEVISKAKAALKE